MQRDSPIQRIFDHVHCRLEGVQLPLATPQSVVPHAREGLADLPRRPRLLQRGSCSGMTALLVRGLGDAEAGHGGHFVHGDVSEHISLEVAQEIVVQLLFLGLAALAFLPLLPLFTLLSALVAARWGEVGIDTESLETIYLYACMGMQRTAERKYRKCRDNRKILNMLRGE